MPVPSLRKAFQNLASRIAKASANLTFCFLIISVILLVSYQLSFVIYPQGTGMLELDNLEYLLYAKLALAQHTFNTANPYLVYFPNAPFFEHPGLFQLPLLLHYGLPSIPLLWDFRIIYLIPIALIYLLSLWVVGRILDATPLNKSYKYLA